MTNNILIVNGVVSTDDLSKLGIDAAKKFHKADKVYLIDNSGKARQIKYSSEESLSEVVYIDARR